MNEIEAAKSLGWFSLALGAFELFAARRMVATLGVGSAGLIRVFGVREIAAGLAVLGQPDKAVPIWGRLAGDAMDATVLATGLKQSNRQRRGAAWALAFVLSAAALDAAVATALSHREQRSQATARLTRVKQTFV